MSSFLRLGLVCRKSAAASTAVFSNANVRCLSISNFLKVGAGQTQAPAILSEKAPPSDIFLP